MGVSTTFSVVVCAATEVGVVLRIDKECASGAFWHEGIKNSRKNTIYRILGKDFLCWKSRILESLFSYFSEKSK